MTKWTHKVIKLSRGMGGAWFAYPAALTGTEQECVVLARSFAAEQTADGATGHRITVQTRGRAVVLSLAT